ncbi:XRE family transcriptional regulator [Thalassospira profundimaris]|uniref:Cro/Cl family transcriptional regulator n=1 Tax=Thalassospira profundimaris TaxID=502049 RepID=A0A367WP25_9PROT|nr:XRE family transcriptional regulator [Thalassospira profundimaris]RCK43225.1 Cro/Cl family transcriptional regulator [Thalassospira profundimaris]
MARSLNEMLAREKPEVVARAKEEAAEILMELNLAELRAILDKTQGEIALALGVAQPTIARMEKPDNDLRVSSLKRYIEAAGGKLRLDVELPDGKHYGFSI